MKIFYTILAFLLLPKIALAAPSISGVSGTWTHSSQVTISGSGFGTKATATPQRWDNFESGSNGVSIEGRFPIVGSAWSVWSNQDCINAGNDIMSYRNTITRNGSEFSIGANFPADMSCYNISLDMYGTYHTIYFTWWSYWDKTSEAWPRQIKPWDLMGPADMQPIAYAGYGWVPGGDGGLRSNLIDGGGTCNGGCPGGGSVGTFYGQSSIEDLPGKWVRYEVYLKESSNGVCDGTYSMTGYNNPGSSVATQEIYNTTVRTRVTNNSWNELQIPGFVAANTADGINGIPGASSTWYLDDIYLDNTPQRVEICDTFLWSNRTRCEIQIPSAWSVSSSSVTVNQGSFSSGANAYLYVVDSTGAMNANGYPVTFGSGGGGDTTAPTYPTGLTVR